MAASTSASTSARTAGRTAGPTAGTHRLLDRVARDLDDYVAHGGGAGLDATRRADPSEIVERVVASGLRGRGGAGFPTGVKWRTIGDFASPTTPTPVVVNAAEGEPGTFKDRLLLRRNPYRVLEGALIAAHAVGSPQIVVAAKASFTIEIARLQRAIDELDAAGWLGDVTAEIAVGPSEYLFGEETGLLEVLEGRPPFPRVTPPWRRGIDPAHPENAHSAADVQLATAEGSPSAPALVDNVETLANVPLIATNGPEWYRSCGTERSPGTILCTVTGATARHGVGEFELGTPVAEVIERIGGGPRPDRTIRAVLSGVSNPPLPADRLDTPLTYEDLAAAGSGLGSASFIVVDDSVSPRWVASQVARFLAVESCGQCEPCKRDGLAIAGELGVDGDARPARLADLLGTVARGARCNLARQTESVVAGVLALGDAAAPDGPPAEEDADVMAIVPTVDLVEGRALLDLSHRDKAPDWTYPDEAPSRPIWPIQRLADQAVTIRPPHVDERPPRTEVAVSSLDPMAVVSALDRVLQRSIGALERADAEARPAARVELRDELHRHIDLLERIVLPLLERLRDDGADIGRYPDEHARRAYALLGAGRPGAADREAIDHARKAVDEVQVRIVPLLRDGLDARHRRQAASALVLEASLLGIAAADRDGAVDGRAMIGVVEAGANPGADDARTVRVLLVDDHAVVVEGIAALLAGDDDISVVARAGDIAGALRAAATSAPDVILLDFRLPDGTGAEAIDRLRQAGCDAPVVMLTAATDRRALRLSLQAGCLGFLSKNAERVELVRAIRAAARNETAFSADMLTQLVHVGRVSPAADGELTERECDVLQYSAEGCSPEEIAERMHLSHHTVRNHLRHAMEKLGAHTKLAAVVKAMQAGLISVER